jgi:hypothetical protein
MAMLRWSFSYTTVAVEQSSENKSLKRMALRIPRAVRLGRTRCAKPSRAEFDLIHSHNDWLHPPLGPPAGSTLLDDAARSV